MSLSTHLYLRGDVGGAPSVIDLSSIAPHVTIATVCLTTMVCDLSAFFIYITFVFPHDTLFLLYFMFYIYTLFHVICITVLLCFLYLHTIPRTLD
jgi:hypothetical protein